MVDLFGFRVRLVNYCGVLSKSCGLLRFSQRLARLQIAEDLFKTCFKRRFWHVLGKRKNPMRRR